MMNNKVIIIYSPLDVYRKLGNPVMSVICLESF